MSGSLLLPAVVFGPAAAASLAASGVLVTRLERLSARFGLPEALLGLAVALAADAPEVTAAVAALASGQHAVGAGVVLGSNAFNLAALLGLSAVVAGRIALHRRVLALEGAVALWLAAISLALVGGLPAGWALLLALAVLAPYLVVSAVHPAQRHRLPLPGRWRAWLADAVSEEEAEITAAQAARAGGIADALAGAAALALVVGASIVMERSATAVGGRLGVPGIVTGGIVLAAVTSLPNAVAAVYLARRGRASATLSGALNSNTLNVVAGLLIPALFTGLGRMTAGTVITAAWYGGLTVITLALAWQGRGLARRPGASIIAAYLVLIPVLLAS
jgi:cation:H+ antiporter